MMINLKDVTCIQIGNVMLGIKDIEKISIHDGGVWITINGDLIQGDIETKIGRVLVEIQHIFTLSIVLWQNPQQLLK